MLTPSKQNQPGVCQPLTEETLSPICLARRPRLPISLLLLLRIFLLPLLLLLRLKLLLLLLPSPSEAIHTAHTCLCPRMPSKPR